VIERSIPTSRRADEDDLLRCREVHRSDGVALKLRGDLDLSSAPALLRKCQQLLCLPIESLTLNLGALTFIDSTGVSALVETRGAARDRGITLRLRDVPDHAYKMLSLTGVLPLFDWRARGY
jgi:anti-sigma B factor antagonist